MFRKTHFTTLCGIAILSATTLGQVISTPASRDPATQRAPAPGSAVADPYNVSPDAQQAAASLDRYLSDHRDELQPKLDAVRFDRNGGPEELGKLKSLLPSDIAATVDTGLPILNARRRDAQITVNLTAIGRALLKYAHDTNDTLPANFGQIVTEVPSIETFVRPDTPLPNEIAKGTPEQQAIWVQSHGLFTYLAAGKDLSKLSPQTIIAHESLDANLSKPTLAVLFADGRVQSIARAKLAEMLRGPGTPLTDV